MAIIEQKDLPVPRGYQQLSNKFTIAWNASIDRKIDAAVIYMEMIELLESNGYTRTQAIDKIASDHKNLRQFSRATIYRKLPDDMKRKYAHKDNIVILPDITNANVSNETFIIDEDGNEVVVDNTLPPFKFTSKNVTNEVMEMLKRDSIRMKQKYDEIERNKEQQQKQQPQQQEHKEDDDDDQTTAATMTTEIYDKDFVNRLVQENKKLQDENNKLKLSVKMTEEPSPFTDEEKPVKSWTLAEYEEEHPTVAESPWEAIGNINRSLARLWTALTKQKNMPTRQDDVMKDYIIPSRERLKDIANGSSKTERVFLFNWLTWIIMATKDCRDVFEKADKTAYDTRE